MYIHLIFVLLITMNSDSWFKSKTLFLATIVDIVAFRATNFVKKKQDRTRRATNTQILLSHEPNPYFSS